MCINKLKKFSRVEVLIKQESLTGIVNGTNIQAFTDCELTLTGNFIIIKVETEKFTTNTIFDLNKILSYRTYT